MLAILPAIVFLPSPTVAMHVRENSSAGLWQAKCVYPSFGSQSRVARFASKDIQDFTRKAYAEWLRTTRANIASARRAGSTASWEYLSTPTLSIVRDDFVSGYFTTYSFEGGAHGMTTYQPFNYAAVDGAPKKLRLNDVLVAGGTTSTVISDLVIGKLRQDPRAQWVHEGEVTVLRYEQFQSFVVTPTGLTYIFEPYAMGPYAVGTFFVKLSATELKPWLQKSGPAVRIFTGLR